MSNIPLLRTTQWEVIYDFSKPCEPPEPAPKYGFKKIDTLRSTILCCSLYANEEFARQSKLLVTAVCCGTACELVCKYDPSYSLKDLMRELIPQLLQQFVDTAQNELQHLKGCPVHREQIC